MTIFLEKNDFDSLHEWGFWENDFSHVRVKFQDKLIEQNEDCHDYFKNEEESILEGFLNKSMGNFLQRCLKMLDKNVP